MKKKKKKLYYTVVTDNQMVDVALCHHCEQYLMVKTTNNRTRDYWPAMVYVFLSCKTSGNLKSVPFRLKWRLIPATWRRWWSDVLADRIEDVEEDPMFQDVTSVLLEMEEVFRELRWVDLAKCVDKHFAFPEVLCVP